ncbi:hypothetical protein [Legionella cardiaca]|uniref:Ankyrin repeat protein n=1 Tax=Legionella cardiaca TaxID=1071983 RepID=A0ABY8AZH3_9GAMM|nr:hypothetical protein [Legionella cardiaca]WED44497.1 hypothetical protein PXX05_06850 [Legionella cardiaca]
MPFKFFNKDYLKTPLGMSGTIKVINNSPRIVKANEIHQLLQDKNCPSRKGVKVLRFLLRTDGELVFAFEGFPSGPVPAHWQMTEVNTPWEAKCITAGNAFFDENNVLQRINHKSGDFRPPFDSLQFVFPKLVKDKLPLANTLVIQELDNAGATKNKYKVSREDIFTFWGLQSSIEQENIDLKLLEEFRNKKLALNKKNQFGTDYNDSILNFYTKAVEIRKSGSSIKDISQQLKQLAHDQFHHRHSTRRLIADTLMIIGFMFGGLGLLVGLSRVATGRSFFFSGAMTAREKDFAQNWLNKEIAHKGDDAQLFNSLILSGSL